MAAGGTGCGGGSAPGATTGSAGATAGQWGGGSSPNDVLAAARAALRDADSYRAHGMLDEGVDVDLKVTRTAAVGTITVGGSTWHVVQDDGRLYFRGAGMWRATLGTAAANRFGDRWVRVTTMSAGWGWAAHLIELQKEMVEQVFRDKAGLRNVGVRRFAGQRVVELSSPHDVYDIRLAGPHVPVRWLEPPVVDAGGDPCGIVLSDFGVRVAVTEPATSARY